jgi:hypothetical protein
MKVQPGVVVAEVGSGGVLLDTHRPAAAYLSPTALGWLRGQPPAAEHREQHENCVTQWRAAGLIPRGDQPAEAAVGEELAAAAANCAGVVPHPVLVVAMSADCAFCSQLNADLAANAHALRHLDGSVLLVDGDGVTPLGRPLPHPARAPLSRLGRLAAPRGTPTAVHLPPGRPARVLTGFDEVSRALVALSGADPGATVIEAPTSCSVNVAAEPVDAVLTARVGGVRLGIAVRGQAARQVAETATASAVVDDAYVPVTLTVERPENLYLLFRGGELLSRARTPAELEQTLAAVLTGYASHTAPAQGEIPLLCGAAVHRDGQAVLFPRTWMSDLVKRARQLERAGWRLRPEPYTTLRPAADSTGLQLPARPGSGQPGTAVTAVLTQPPQSGPAPTRARLLASIVNWIARPASTEAVHALAAGLRPLPVHAGSWQEAVSHLTQQSG